MGPVRGWRFKGKPGGIRQACCLHLSRCPRPWGKARVLLLISSSMASESVCPPLLQTFLLVYHSFLSLLVSLYLWL